MTQLFAPTRRILQVLLVPTLILLSPTSQSGAIDWQPWEQETFATARDKNRLIFVEVGTQWCPACKRMHQVTLANTDVIARLQSHFVAISIDAEAQPDLSERYAAWGWPALIFFNPDGAQIKALRGNYSPENFIAILDQLIEQHQQRGNRVADPFPETGKAVETSLGELLLNTEQRLDSFYDLATGGWGGKTKSPLPAAVSYALRRSHSSGDPEWLERAVKTQNRIRDLIDPVWGGVAAATESGDNPDDWTKGVANEKKTALQAGVLANFAELYHHTGDRRWRQDAERIYSFLNQFLRSPSGAYYASQDGEPARSITASPATVRNDYYLMQDTDRRAHGLPAVDKTVFADINARLISALVSLHEATGDDQYLQQAEITATYLVTHHLLPDGWYAQTTQDPPPRYGERSAERLRQLPGRQKLYLRTQALTGQALLALFRATSNPTWLRRAQRLGEATISYLYDLDDGGFYATPLMPIKLGERSANYKPFIDNALMADFLIDLGRQLSDRRFTELAETSLRVISHNQVLQYQGYQLGEYLLTLDKLVHPPVDIRIVTTSLDQQTAELHRAALAAYEPTKVIRIERPGNRQDLGKPAIYACAGERCSDPITSPTALPEELKRLRAELKSE